MRYLTTPGLTPPKFTDTRPMKAIGAPMITIVTAQILRHVTDDPICDEWIERSIDEIERDFMKPDLEVVTRAGRLGRRYRTPTTLFGLPLVDIAIGATHSETRGTARGVLAIGDFARGLIAARR